MYFIKKRSLILAIAFMFVSNFIIASDLDLNYKPQSDQYQVQQKLTYLNADSSPTNAFKNMGADGKKNMLESDAKNRKMAEQKSKRKGKGNGQRKGKHSMGM